MNHLDEEWKDKEEVMWKEAMIDNINIENGVPQGVF